MNRRYVIPVLASLVGATAQQPGLGQAPANASVPVAVSRSAGLQPAPGGNGLHGGGADYRARFTTNGVRFEPALGRAAATTQHLALRPQWLARGEQVLAETPGTAPRADGLVAIWEHAAFAVERCEVRPEGLELSWLFPTPLPGDGDLVVRYAIDTGLPAPRRDGAGLTFELPEVGGVRVGGVHGIDAAGRRADGTLRLVPGGVEFVLPAAFVATARYPLVLDPTVGAIVPVTVGIDNDADPDVAYDATTNRWLIVWQRTFASYDRDIRGQRLSSSGALVGTTIFFGSAGVASRPRLANLRSRARFGVVWSQNTFLATSIEFAAVDAATGAITHDHSIPSTNGFSVLQGDIGTASDVPTGTCGFVIVFAHNENADGTDARVRAQRIRFSPSDSQSNDSPFDVVNPNGSATPVRVNVSRTAAADGILLVTVAAGSNLHVAAVQTDASQVVANTVGLEFFLPQTDADVDGRGGNWVLGWQRDAALGGGTPSVGTAPVTFVNSILTIGTPTFLGGTHGIGATAPSVGYTPGKAWLCYRQSSAASAQSLLRVRGIDSTTCASCNDTFSDTVNGAESRIVVGTMTSGGDTSGDNALAVWVRAGDVYAQRLVNHGNGGTITMLGGACGSGGTQAFAHNPAIGSSGLACSVSGLPPAATMTVFNLSPVMTLTDCGGCQWLPFADTQLVNVTAASARVELPIPCQQALVGTQFETQWTTVDPSQTNCPVLPGYTMTSRALLTIGQ